MTCTNSDCRKVRIQRPLIAAMTAAVLSVPLYGQTTEDYKLTASDAGPGDTYGFAVAIDNNVAIVGAENDSSVAFQAGSAYIHRFDGTTWVEEQKLTAFDGINGDGFGVSVDIEGDLAVVGAWFGDGNVINSGAVYIYRYNSGTWSLDAKIFASDGSSIDFFGENVSLSGDVVLVGARRDDDAGSSSGSSYVFRYNGTNWDEEQKLTASDASGGQGFGSDVSVSGDFALMGASSDDDGAFNAGAAYIFRYEAPNWVQKQKLIASDAEDTAVFGHSVSIDNDVAVIGAPLDDSFSLDDGAAYVFRFDGTSTWVEEAKLIASNAQGLAQFGWDVSVCDGVVAVGADEHDETGATNGGTAYIFTHDGLNWNEDAQLTASDLATDDEFGSSIAVCGNAIIGAPANDDDGTSSGAAYIFILNNSPIAVCSAGPSSGDGDTGSNITLECDQPSGRSVTLDGSGSFDPDTGDTLTYHWDVSDSDVVLDDPDSAIATGVFPVGVTMATLTVSDGRGGVDTCDVTVTVQDTTAPEVLCTTDIAKLWPPNHSMRVIKVYVEATDACTSPEDIVPVTVTVRSDEPDNGSGDGNTTGDVNGFDGYTTPVNITSSFAYDSDEEAWIAIIQLRAERSGGGDGRAYTVDASAIDSQMNIGTASCVVVVPHSKKK